MPYEEIIFLQGIKVCLDRITSRTLVMAILEKFPMTTMCATKAKPINSNPLIYYILLLTLLGTFVRLFYLNLCLNCSQQKQYFLR